LIVEDDEDWCGLYQRNVTPVVPGVVEVAQTMDAALEAVRKMAFAVAFVDIHLDTHDDQNTGGLRVLEALCRARDFTSSFMVTGKGSVGITRDALIEYGAHDAIAKADIKLSDLQQFVEDGTNKRNNEAGVNEPRAADVLRGRNTAEQWDDEMMRATGRGGVASLYDFLEHLVRPLMPLVRRGTDGHMRPAESDGVAVGEFWSRGVGKPVVIAVGEAEKVRRRRESDETGRDNSHKILREREKGKIGGFVVETGESRDAFPD